MFFCSTSYIRKNKKWLWCNKKKQIWIKTGFPHICLHRLPTHFQKPFSILLYLLNTKWKNFNTITYLHFSQILFMEYNAKNKTAISGKEQNLNKRMAESAISLLFQYFIYILHKFNTFSRFWISISEFNTFSIPCGNPAYSIRFLAQQTAISCTSQ